MAKKFKILQAASKLPPAALAAYKDYRAGNVTITRTGKPLGQKKTVYLYPFGVAQDVDSHTPVTMGGEAFGNISNLSSGLTVFNISETTASENAIFNPGFTPAKAIITLRGTKKATDPRSAITLQTYSAYNAESSTIPFGAKASGASFFQEVAQDIKTSAKAKNNKHSVTFKPEQWKVY